VEIGLAVLIVGLMMSAVLSNLGSVSQSQGARAVADRLAADLRSVRSEAMSSGWPTAVVIPSDQGQLYSAEGYYILGGGPVKPRVVRRVATGQEAPGVRIAAPIWPKADGEKWDGTTPNLGPGFLPNSWDPPYPLDFHLVFLPSGKVLSNGWPHSGNGYSFVVSNGISAAPGADMEGTPSFTVRPQVRKINSVANPYTVSVSLDGSVSSHKGLTSSSLEPSETTVGEKSAALPPLDPEPNSVPVILSVDAFPKPESDEDGEPSIVTPKGGRLSLQVEAESPDGMPLSVNWTGPGHFSAAADMPMEWNPEEKVWRNRIDWTPPSNAEDGDSFELQARVKDSLGHLNANQNSGQIKTTIADLPWRVAYAKDNAIWQVEMDGSGRKKICDANLGYQQYCGLVTSPDGTKILTMEWVEDHYELRLVVPGISKVKTLVAGAPEARFPQWAPKGDYILYTTQDRRLFRHNLANNTSQQLSSDVVNFQMSPDGTKIAIDNSRGLSVTDANGANPVRITNRWGDYCPTISPDNERLVFMRDAPVQVMTASASGGNVKVLHPPGSNFASIYAATQVTFSPDGKKVAYPDLANGLNGKDLILVDFSTGSNTVISDIGLPAGSGFDTTVWSPDGKYFVTRGSSAELLLISSDGSSRKVLDTNIGRGSYGWMQ
jgi:WD40 repeat protein